MPDYGLDFLKEKGFFESENKIEDEYDTGKTITYIFDPANRLAYFDSFEKEEIQKIFSAIRKKRNFDYYWFWKDERIVAFRTYGENKLFIFNTAYSKRTDYVKSKEDKLSKFSSSNPGALFEVKDIIARFYRRLWDLRLKLAKAIGGDFSDRDKILTAQRLLDRLIFTYFLAEKGIVYGKDGKGRRLPVNARKLFAHLIEKSEDFHGVLNDIFFEYLNNPTKKDMPIDGTGGTSLWIPYLNGGLFRERRLTSATGENVGEAELTIDDFDWSELIRELNEYNWIIGDYTGAEEEETIGNLTPEILGHIYEKFVITVSELDEIDVDELETTSEGELKKGNKKIGAYYTPEVITTYIAKNTVFPFAMDRLGLDGKYEDFNGFYEDHKDDPEILSRLNDVLKEIKILDPAVGSGAFPMAAADLLFDWRRKCGETLDDYALRREIVINNLHGVDIMEGAVEICMLRLWLWLIAAADPEKEIDALPNIDFNIFEGNSLIGYTDTREIADISMKKRKKRKAWKSLDVQYAKLDSYTEDSILNLFKRRNEKIRGYKKAEGKRADELRREIDEMTEEFNRILNAKLLSELRAKGIDIDEEGLKALKPFHWVMEFSEVFENGGFDVAIGNPPYGDILTGKEKFAIEDYLTADIREIAGNFVERELKLLVNTGYLGNIITLGLVYRGDISYFHDFILKHTKRTRIACFERRPCQLFKDAQIQVGIIISQKNKPNSSPSEIETSSFIRFNASERDTVLSKLSFVSIEGLVLRDRINGNDMAYQVIPKIGDMNMYSVLVKLKENSNRIVSDFMTDKEEFTLYRQRGGGYRPIAILEKLYESGELAPLYFSSNLIRKVVFLIVNSSLFYLFWMVYGDARHVNTGQIARFPLPSSKTLSRYNQRITHLSDKLWLHLQEVFDKNRNYFYISKKRKFLGQIDDLLGELYGLTKEEIEFVKNYDSQYIWTKED